MKKKQITQEQINKTLAWNVYEPLDYQKRMGYGVRLDRCRFQIPEGGRSVSFRQCSRKPKVEIEGYGFCTAHGRAVQKQLNRK